MKINNLGPKIYRAISGLIASFSINCGFFYSRYWSKKKIFIFQLHSANQFDHIRSLLQELTRDEHLRTINAVVLVYPSDIKALRILLEEEMIAAKVYSYYSTSFLVFWNIVIAIDQRMRLPLVCLSKGSRICMFHGQPTKGNVYSGFNYRQFDGLSFYGPLMRDYYVREKSKHDKWPDIPTWNIGQPKSDEVFRSNELERKAASLIGVDASKKTIVYAPSFESCGSLAIFGENIIRSLATIDANVIVKPHPAFYRVLDKSDKFFSGVPHASEWREFASSICELGNVVFPLDKQIRVEYVLSLADVLVTDHSGIAFDAMLLDIPVIYFDCPEFFLDYLPKQYGVDGESARRDIFSNAGRDSGEVVEDISSLLVAVDAALSNREINSDERRKISEKLLYNPGQATEFFIRNLINISRD